MADQMSRGVSAVPPPLSWVSSPQNFFLRVSVLSSHLSLREGKAQELQSHQGLGPGSESCPPVQC